VSLQLSNFSGAKESFWRISAVTASGNNGDLVFNGYAGGADYPERMRIDSSGNLLVGRTGASGLGILNVEGGADFTGGNVLLCRDTGSVGIGTSSPSRKAHITDPSSGTNGQLRLAYDATNYADYSYYSIDVAASNPFVIKTGGTERMRIDASGNLLVGGTSVLGRITANGAAGVAAIGTTVATAINYNAISFHNNAGTQVGRILANDAGTTQYITSSDQRLKENIADADDAGSKIDAIQVRKFDWISDGSHQDYGMIAQELQVVAPEAVAGDADSEEVMGVDYSKLVPMMLKEIQSLRARVSELESK